MASNDKEKNEEEKKKDVEAQRYPPRMQLVPMLVDISQAPPPPGSVPLGLLWRPTQPTLYAVQPEARMQPEVPVLRATLTREPTPPAPPQLKYFAQPQPPNPVPPPLPPEPIYITQPPPAETIFMVEPPTVYMVESPQPVREASSTPTLYAVQPEARMQPQVPFLLATLTREPTPPALPQLKYIAQPQPPNPVPPPPPPPPEPIYFTQPPPAETVYMVEPPQPVREASSTRSVFNAKRSPFEGPTRHRPDPQTFPWLSLLRTIDVDDL